MAASRFSAKQLAFKGLFVGTLIYVGAFHKLADYAFYPAWKVVVIL